ncbi:MAG: hypothetical protein ACPGU7_05790 [Gammaproteobacteria bacterium]
MPWYSNDDELADYAWYRLSRCLEDGDVFAMHGLAETRAAVEALGVDLKQYFGLEDPRYKALGQRIGSRYIMSGAFTIVSELTLSGVRKYATVNLFLHRSNTGDRLARFEIPYGVQAVPNPGGDDPEQLTEAAMDRLCAQIAASTRRSFREPPPERTEHGLPVY